MQGDFKLCTSVLIWSERHVCVDHQVAPRFSSFACSFAQGQHCRSRQSPQLRPQVTRAQGRGDQAAQAAKKPVKAAQQTGLFQGLAAAQGRLNDSNVSWTTFLGLGLLAGVTFGSVIQISHNNPNLPVSFFLSLFDTTIWLQQCPLMFVHP